MKKYHGAFIKNEREVGCLREANRMVANILDAVADMVAPGLPTMRLEELARDMCADYKVKPAFLGYCGYPVSIDMGVVFEGFVGDAARTYPVGQVSDEARRLMRVTEESLYVGIEKARAGNDVYDIGAAVQDYVEAAGFNVVRRFVGHGVGAKMHEKPEVPNFRPGMHGLTLQNGMVIAIEPMVTAGTYEVDILDDKWTAVTRDGQWAAHFEHSVAITPEGPRILSISDRGLNRHTIDG